MSEIKNRALILFNKTRVYKTIGLKGRKSRNVSVNPKNESKYKLI